MERMQTSVLSVDRTADTVELRLATPNGVLTRALLVQLRRLLAAQPGRAVVLTGSGERFFSPGLDLNEVGELDRPSMAEFMRVFRECTLQLFLHPAATVCAVNGHALAGGFVLASCCDFRVGVSHARIGLTGLNRLLPLPEDSRRIVGQLLGDRAGREVLSTGSSFPSRKALQLGWLDRLVEPSELAAAARGQTRAPSPPPGRERKQRLVDRLRKGQEQALEEFLDAWFSPAVQGEVARIRRRLRRPAAPSATSPGGDSAPGRR